MTDGLEIQIETTVRIAPALPHLSGEGARATVVIQSLTARAPDQASLEELLPDALAQVAVSASRSLTAHPARPSWSARRLLQHAQFTHEVNTGQYPYLHPTPAEPGHAPGSWLDCQRCRDKITEEAPA